MQFQEVVTISLTYFLACADLCEPGDEVLVEQPAYEPLRAVPSSLGLRVKRFSRNFDNKYGIDRDEIAEKITSLTKLLILTDPHNPSGTLLPPEQLNDLIDLCRARNINLLIDEVYREFAQPRYRSSFTLGDHIIAAASLTKVFGLGGLRCGWMIADPVLTGKMNKANDYFHVEHVFIAEQIAALAFDRPDSLLEKSLPILDYNLAMTIDFIAGEPALSWCEPCRGAISFPLLSNRSDSAPLFDILLKKSLIDLHQFQR